MPTPTGYTPVSVPESRLDDFFEVDQWAFIGEWRPEDRDLYVAAVETSRCRAVEVAEPARGTVGEYAGVYSSFGTEMTVPGGRVATAGLSWVGVHPAHRRRGILRSMITDHFEQCREAGEAVSALYATGPEIYARFGYGLGSQTVKAQIPPGLALRDVPGSDDLTVRLERADFDKHDALVQSIQDQLSRPGTIIAPEGSGRNARFTDPEGNRGGMEKWRIAIVEDKGTPVAYGFFRRRAATVDGTPKGQAQVREVGALNPAAAHRLWSVLTSFDLVETVVTENVATDDPLLKLAANSRILRPLVIDNLWVRVLDVKAALEAREYYRDIDVTIALTDETLPDNAGNWRLTVEGGRAAVARTEGEADLAMDVRDLSSAYLGGQSVASLAAAGLVTESTPGAVEDLAVSMRSLVAPLANWDF